MNYDDFLTNIRHLGQLRHFKFSVKCYSMEFLLFSSNKIVEDIFEKS
jgi:hypothetical protein